MVNVATIFESENFFLPGIKWNGILGLAYAALAKVGITQNVRIPRNGREFGRQDSLARGSGGPSENHVVGRPVATNIFLSIFKIKGKWHNSLNLCASITFLFVFCFYVFSLCSFKMLIESNHLDCSVCLRVLIRVGLKEKMFIKFIRLREDGAYGRHWNPGRG